MACAESPNCSSDCPECNWQPMASPTLGPEAGEQVLADEHGLADLVSLLFRATDTEEAAE